VHRVLHKFFKWWAKILLKAPCPVFTVTLVLFMIISLNCLNYKSFEDPKTVWTPFGNTSIKNRDRAAELYADPLPANMT